MKSNQALFTLLLSSFLALSGCSKKDDKKDPEPTPKYDKVTVRIGSSISTVNDHYDLEFEYGDDFFSRDAKKYDKQLSLLSFGNSIASSSKEENIKFYTTLGFKDITSYDYDVTPSEDTIGHFFAHKKIGNSELFAVNFRGFEYGGEWVNNFIIGKTGDHEGFSIRANEVYAELKEYITQMSTSESLKLWINGYSRGGALSGVLSHLILSGGEINVSQNNMYVYTFEAPTSLTEEHAIAYKNVHNVINSNDLITNVPPHQYELKRCGVDHEIYSENLSSIVKKFDSSINIPAFATFNPGSGVVHSDAEFLDAILASIFDYTNSDETLVANDRDHYVDNYQTGLSHFIGYIFMLSPVTRSMFLSAFKSNAGTLVSDTTGTQLKDFIKPYLDSDGISYNETVLLSDCATVCKAALSILLKVVIGIGLSTDYQNNLMRLVQVHYPEVEYALIINAHKAK